MNETQRKWMAWIAEVRTQHLTMPFGNAPKGTLDFFSNHYAMHMPAVLQVPRSPAMAWTIDSLRQKVPDIQIETQAGRTARQDHESNPGPLRSSMTFHRFLHLVEHGAANDTYLTARNAQHNKELMRHLAADLMPLPQILRPNANAGFLWIGRDTRTELHIDHTNNLLIQLVGTRIVRLVSPWSFPRLPNPKFVYTSLRWVDAESADAHGISYIEIVLKPGDALFIPIGWYHCVESPGISMMASFTNFWWNNVWGMDYPSP